jgi:hypothetical protein
MAAVTVRAATVETVGAQPLGVTIVLKRGKRELDQACKMGAAPSYIRKPMSTGGQFALL